MNSTEERCLWKRTMSPETLRRNDSAETLASMQARFASTPPKLSFWQLCSRSHVVVQEISITAYLLTRHRLLIEMKERQFTTDSRRNSASSCFIVVALLVVLFFGSRGESAQDRRAKVTQRATDGLLSATLLRLMASFLQSLTASYASDTLYTLAVAGLALHILACDYSYANGRNHNSSKKNHVMNALGRPLFHGGTVSLNSALFSTMLLVSRLDTSEAYFFIYFAIVLFAFYPVSRNSITASFPAHDNVALWLVTLLVCLATGVLLKSWHECVLFVIGAMLFGLFMPLWRFVAQKNKVFLLGPWDIPTKIV